MERFEGKATLASTIAEVGENCDVVGICVQNDEQVLQCVEPLLPAMNPGSVLLIHSTIRPAPSQAIAPRACERGSSTDTRSGWKQCFRTCRSRRSACI